MMYTLFAFQVPAELEIPRADLIRRGVPERALLDRSLRDCLRCAVSDEEGWAASGPAEAMSLVYRGKPLGTITITGQDWEITWDHLATNEAGLSREELESLAEYWAEGVEWYRETMEGPAIRKVLDRLLGEVPEHRATLVPGLRCVPASSRALVLQIRDLLPEVPFWACEVPTAPPGPVKKATDAE